AATSSSSKLVKSLGLCHSERSAAKRRISLWILRRYGETTNCHTRKRLGTQVLTDENISHAHRREPIPHLVRWGDRPEIRRGRFRARFFASLRSAQNDMQEAVFSNLKI